MTPDPLLSGIFVKRSLSGDSNLILLRPRLAAACATERFEAPSGRLTLPGARRMFSHPTCALHSFIACGRPGSRRRFADLDEGSRQGFNRTRENALNSETAIFEQLYQFIN